MRYYIPLLISGIWALALLPGDGMSRTALERQPQSGRGIYTDRCVSLPADTTPAWVGATQKVLDMYRVPPGSDGVARVRYAALARDTTHLKMALNLLGSTERSQLTSPAARQAFWYNTYNLVMIDVVLKEWGGDPQWSVSTQNFRVFKEVHFRWMGIDLSLDDIEHGILRGRPEEKTTDVGKQQVLRGLSQSTWGGGRPDPHLHLVLNCASVGCPSLTAQALDPLRLSSQLQGLAIQYLSDTKRGAGPQGISSLFNWFAGDFLPDGKDKFIQKYVPAGVPVNYTHYLPYDWSLNVATQTP